MAHQIRHARSVNVSRAPTGESREGGKRGDASLSVTPMSDVTRVLSAIEQGDPRAAEQLLPLVYQELRQLAAQKLAGEKPGQTLQATALVHEAYVRLVDVEKRSSLGTAAATSSPRRPKPCAASSSRRPGRAAQRQARRRTRPH